MAKEIIMAAEIEREENKRIRNRILAMIIPITIENILQMMTGFVSMAMIGRIDAIAVGALGISNRITQIIWALFNGIATGVTVFVAQAYGSNNREKIKKVAIQSLMASVILVVILQQIIFWNASNILKIFDPNDVLLQNGTMYLKISSWGLPFITIVLIVAGILHGVGNTKTPMQIVLIMNIMNIFFSYILIFGKFGISPLKLKGAAISIVLAQIIAAFLGIWVLFGKDGILSNHFNKKSFKLDKEEIISIYKVGLPTSFESIFWQIAAIIITKAILTYGESALAAYQLGLQAESISYMPAAGFSVAATTFIGQTLGSGEKDLGRKYLKQLVIGTSIITIFTGGTLTFFPQLIMRLLTNNKELISIGIGYLVAMGVVQIPQNIAGVLNGALRGAGFTRVPMIVAGVGLWLIRVPSSLLAAYYFKTSISVIWIIIGVDMFFRFLLSFIIYKTKDIYNMNLIINK
jgi:putative MATE family efflux protein